MPPLGPIGIIPLIGSAPFTGRVNDYLLQRRTEYLKQ